MAKKNKHLSKGISFEDIYNAFTDPNKQFQFPIQDIGIKTDRETKNTIYLTGVIIGISIIAGFMILKK